MHREGSEGLGVTPVCVSVLKELLDVNASVYSYDNLLLAVTIKMFFVMNNIIPW